MNKKDKLTTAVERTVHKHVDRVKEATIDFTHLYIQRNNIQVDRPSLAAILEIVRKGIDSEHMNKLDIFIKELDGTLNSVVEED
jgi:hypothetical protein